MKKATGLTTDERDFFSVVHEAVLANPFSDKRASTDLKIAGMFPGVSRDKIIQKAERDKGVAGRVV